MMEQAHPQEPEAPVTAMAQATLAHPDQAQAPEPVDKKAHASKTTSEGEEGMNWWRQYYYRVIGFAVAGAGAGLVLDELIHGPFNLTPGNHEFWGLVLLVVGGIFISKKPHGK